MELLWISWCMVHLHDFSEPQFPHHIKQGSSKRACENTYGHILGAQQSQPHLNPCVYFKQIALPYVAFRRMSYPTSGY